MSSSSAYNVLLKSPVQPQSAVAPKRDYQNESDAFDFQQTLKDVHDTSLRQKDLHDKDTRAQANRTRDARDQNAHKELRDSTRRQDEKLAKANNQKAATTADNHKQANDASVKKQAVDTAAQVDQKVAADNVCVEDKALSDKASNDKQIKKADDTTVDVTSTTPVVSPVTIPSETTLPIALIITPAAIAAQETAPTIAASLDLNAVNPANNQIVEGTDLPLAAQLPEGEAKGDDAQLTLDPSLPKTITPEAAIEVTSEQAKPALIPQSEEQAPGVLLAATGSVSAAATNPVTTPADVIASLAIDVLGAGKTLGKPVTTEVSPEVDPESEAAPAATQIADPKSTFEKMLQTVARSGVAAPEDSAPASTATTNTPNSSTHSNAADSLLRLSDVQAPAARNFVVQTAVPVPVGQPKWSEAVGEKVLWLAAQNVSSAEINLHPKDLGPIQVKVSVNQEQASVSFTSHHAVVREVLDQNLNRLRDMFNEQGLNLVNVDVSDKSFSRQQGEGKDQKGQGTNNSVEDETPVAVSAIVQQRLVDHYA